MAVLQCHEKAGLVNNSYLLQLASKYWEPIADHAALLLLSPLHTWRKETGNKTSLDSHWGTELHCIQTSWGIISTHHSFCAFFFIFHTCNCSILLVLFWPPNPILLPSSIAFHTIKRYIHSLATLKLIYLTSRTELYELAIQRPCYPNPVFPSMPEVSCPLHAQYWASVFSSAVVAAGQKFCH